MELHQLRSFVTVASVGSVSQAARHLNLAQPAVSQHIRVLERELGLELFERGTRGMRLTEQGLALVGHARILLAQVADLQLAADRMIGESTTEVQIAATPSLAASLFPRVLEILGSPSTGVRILLYERPTIDSLSLLAGRSVELAIVRDCDDAGFDLERLFEDPLVAAVGVANSIGQQPGVKFLDLAPLPFVLFRHSGREQLHRAALSAFAAAGFTPTTICEGAEVATMGELVMRGMAAAIAPRSIVDLWDADRVITMELPEPRPVSSVYLARLPGNLLSESAMRVARAIRRAATS